MNQPDSSLFAFVEDLRGEGAAEVLDRVAGYGCTGLTIAAAYHRARDVTPHGRPRVTLRHDGTHFPHPPGQFGTLVPPIRDRADEQPIPRLIELATERGITVHGWTVFLHNTTIGLAHPEVTQRNCFGDRSAPADLCPSNPDVRGYAVVLARAVARQGVASVVAESLHFGAFGHGYHHERSFVDLGPIADFLLGLCFCDHCGGQDIVDQAARIVDRVLDGTPPPRTELTLDALPPAIAEFALRRRETVTSLAQEVATAVAQEGSRLVFLDITGALKGYADGQPTGAPAAADAWRLGIDPVAVGAVSPGYAMLGYANDETRIAEDVTAYRDALGSDCELRVVLRPGVPDTTSANHLARKVHAAKLADAVDFYNYGMSPLTVLDRIPHALRAT